MSASDAKRVKDVHEEPPSGLADRHSWSKCIPLTCVTPALGPQMGFLSRTISRQCPRRPHLYVMNRVELSCPHDAVSLPHKPSLSGFKICRVSRLSITSDGNPVPSPVQDGFSSPLLVYRFSARYALYTAPSSQGTSHLHRRVTSASASSSLPLHDVGISLGPSRL